MLVFVTVGSTQFDDLVHTALSVAVLESLIRKGYTKVVVQCGNSSLPPGWTTGSKSIQGLSVDIWQFRPSLHDTLVEADLVISHAGSGTILDVLRLGKPLIVVPNGSLLDDHQKELASALAALSHLKASSVHGLPHVIDGFDPSKLTPFPPFNGAKFASLLDEEMGYAVA